MKTLKFRLIEHAEKRGYTSFSTFSIQYKTGLLWMDYEKIKMFDTPIDCVNEIFEKSRFKKTELRLKEYPRLKFITLKSN